MVDTPGILSKGENTYFQETVTFLVEWPVGTLREQVRSYLVNFRRWRDECCRGERKTETGSRKRMKRSVWSESQGRGCECDGRGSHPDDKDTVPCPPPGPVEDSTGVKNKWCVSFKVAEGKLWGPEGFWTTSERDLLVFLGFFDNW